MAEQQVIFFRPYPFAAGQKIKIAAGKRAGDWEVIAVNGSKVTLRCPVSGREFEWENFCYLVDRRDNVEWPAPNR